MMGAMAVGTAGTKGVGLATKGASGVAEKMANSERLQGLTKGVGNLAGATMKDTMNDAKKAVGQGIGKFAESDTGQDVYSFGKKAGRRYGEMGEALKGAVENSAVGQTAKDIKDGVQGVGAVYRGESDTFKSQNDTGGSLSTPPQELSNALANVNTSLQPDEAQQRINGLLGEISDPESKQQMISSLMASNDVGLEEKNQLVSGVMSGAIDGNPSQMVQDIVTGMSNQPEKQQQLIESMVTNSSIPNESKQQLVEAVMSNKDMGVESKTQLLNTMTSNTPNTESKTQMINSIANGEANAKTQQAFVNEVINSA